MRNNLDLYRNNLKLRPFNFFNLLDADDFDDLIFSDTSLRNSKFPLACDIVENDKNYTYKIDIPGLKKSDINVSINGDTLEVSGERSNEHSSKEKGVKRVERSFGSFYRSFTLPTGVKKDVDASYKDGVLTLVLDKDESANTSKKIEIKG